MPKTNKRLRISFDKKLKKFTKKVGPLFLLEFLKIQMTQNGKTHISHSSNKKSQVNFMNDSINLNKKLKCKPYKIPKSSGMLLKLEDFKYDTPLDLNMVCYH